MVVRPRVSRATSCGERAGDVIAMVGRALLACLAAAAAGAPEVDEGVYVLDEANFDEWIDAQPYALVGAPRFPRTRRTTRP